MKEKWTKELVEEEARKYKVKEHFARGSSGAYKFAVRHNLIGSYNWFETKSKPMGYWTKERCEKESHKYKSRSEYKEKAGGAYEVSRVNNWLDDYVWLENKKVFENKVDTIYGYFLENKTVYIGRTLNPKERDRSHRNSSRKDTIYRYCEEKNIPIPEMTIIESKKTLLEGKKREQYWIEYYQNKGYNVLNKVRGGGIGNLTFIKKNNNDIIKEGKKYSSRTEFREKSPNYYYQAWKRGLLDKIIPSNQTHKKGFWKNKENVINESKKYKTQKEFRNLSSTAYIEARKNGYLQELVWLKRERKIYSLKQKDD